METPGIEPGAFHMQSERSTTELHPHGGMYFLRQMLLKILPVLVSYELFWRTSSNGEASTVLMHLLCMRSTLCAVRPALSVGEARTAF